ncbi:MAG: hypothetical protein Q8O63_13880 [Hoeflea sp.]|nr:hypothetical protein [Hoeflea sp.]
MILYRIAQSRIAGSSPPPDGRNIMTLFPQTATRRTFLTSAMAFGAGAALSVSGIRAARTAPDTTGFAIAFDGNALIVGGERPSRRGNSGASTPLRGPAGGNILSLATHKDRAGRIAAGLTEGGVALSEDGGLNWHSRNKGLPDAPVTAVTVATLSPDTWYASVRGDGLWKSEDAGQSWVFAMDRPWLADAERDLTALASVDLDTGMGGIWIYAGTEMGLTRVPDCFCRWQDVQPGNAMDALASGAAPAPEVPLPAGEPVHALASAASLPVRLYAALTSGVWTSEDAGVVWAQCSATRAQALAVHPENAHHVVAVFDDGLIQSRDAGMSWTALANH